ncbi:acyl-CoA reductase [Pedobacter montanisoli]|uniref:Acyl-CoA reductase n=1 Tax=Pedobacter montanisoli TaxID=2923277 RepID=A0ABS9ZXG9_9SPHI|nr:acyl-CoA reductase [Pedobacter montanisoli]MCJ0742979.1 acyl-CoA reductase [Pedobacter montanisoli]
MLPDKKELANALKQLGNFMQNPSDAFEAVIYNAQNHNAWFTAAEIRKALKALSEMLNPHDLDTWFNQIEMSSKPKNIGLILAGNIPLVGFHDVLCVLATGNIAQIKMSSSDNKLLPALLEELSTYLPAISDHYQFVERLSNFDAVIATGSNNTSRYFEYYFGKVPHIIRKNRNSIAILDGNESEQDMNQLANDIFDYFGMGCRSISKIYIPQHYNIEKFFKPLENHKSIIDHFKYNNNYDYNKSIYLVNGVKHFDNGFLLLKEDKQFSSPLSVLYYEEYDSVQNLTSTLQEKEAEIQCIESNLALNVGKEVLPFGQSQHPKLWDYPDNVDTVDWLNRLIG